MSFLAAFKKIAMKLVAQVAGEQAKDALRRLPSTVREFFWGKKICVIGATGAGKNSFYNRLQRQSVPEEHIQTRGAEKVGSFEFVQPMPDGKPFKLRCKRSLNVGGERDERERYWEQACAGSDFVFYLIDAMKVLRDRDAPKHQDRVIEDLRWIVVKLAKSKRAPIVHLLVNKIDAVLDVQPALEKYVSELEALSKREFGAYSTRISGVTPTSMRDELIFARSFAGALEVIHARCA